MNFGIVVLAAGGSSRMGEPKGLLAYEGTTLVARAARTAIDSGADEVVIVLGAETDALRSALEGLDVRIVVNAAWSEGMGGSIRTGIAGLTDAVGSAVVVLADQPRITAAHLRALAAGLADAPIVASAYDGVAGAPCAFARSEFGRLLALDGDIGARALVRSGAEPVVTIEFEGARTDVDTPEMYRALVQGATD